MNKIMTMGTAINMYGKSDTISASWQDGMVCGNGRIGVVCWGSPYDERYVFQNMDFLVPSDEPRSVPPEVSAELEEARQAVLHCDDTWDVHGRSRTYMYCFQPGGRLHIRLRQERLDHYAQWMDYGSGEISTVYGDKHGTWRRRTFTSREDDIVITKVEKSDRGALINVSLDIDDLSEIPRFGIRKHGTGPEIGIKYYKFTDVQQGYMGLIAHYPEFEESELSGSGYLVFTRVLAEGGRTETVGSNGYKIIDAEEVVLLTKTCCLPQLGKMEAFSKARIPEYSKEAAAFLEEIVKKYSDEKGKFCYQKALAPHKSRHKKMFDTVKFFLGDDAEAESEEEVCNEELLQEQKKTETLRNDLVMRLYALGRYAQISCAGYSVPRLCGLWTGEWNPGWRGAYTMDANVNIQVSGMNTGNIYEAGIGYLYFVLRQLSDWEENAEKIYGMKNAIQIPVNTDGNRAMIVEYDKAYPFQYWNAGASWMMQPVFEFWQCFGNRKIPLEGRLQHIFQKESLDLEREILRPLLLKTMNFWMQLCTPEYYVDVNGNACYRKGKRKLEEGEKYLIVPSYSPENHPRGYDSTITANASMDIAAAKDCMYMVMAVEEKMQCADSEDIVNRCKKFLSELPGYLFDNSGALCEWALNCYQDNNEHRHISHLYCAWPAYETQKDEKLRLACVQAVANRNLKNIGKDDTASHGWIHKALVCARLKDGTGAASILRHLFHSDIFYGSLMTDHNTDRSKGVYCTDTIIGLVGVINEMLVYSDMEQIEFLPAIAPEWTKGRICGLRTRCHVLIQRLTWDVDRKEISAQIVSDVNQEITFSCRYLAENRNNPQQVKLCKGENAVICFH